MTGSLPSRVWREGVASPGDEPEVLHVMRHPKPRGLGSWFSRARFEELKVQLESLDDEMVH